MKQARGAVGRVGYHPRDHHLIFVKEPGQSTGPELVQMPIDVQDAVTAIKEVTAAFDGMEAYVIPAYDEMRALRLASELPLDSVVHQARSRRRSRQ